MNKDIFMQCVVLVSFILSVLGVLNGEGTSLSLKLFGCAALTYFCGASIYAFEPENQTEEEEEEE